MRSPCDCRPDGNPSRLHGSLQKGGVQIDVEGATEHVGDACRWRVVARALGIEAVAMDGDVEIALHTALGALVRTATEPAA